VLRQFKSPGLIPTFALGFNRPFSDGNDPGIAWRGIPGDVGLPNRFTFIDEVVPDDTDYLSQGFGNAGGIYNVNLGAPAIGNATAIVFRVRARRMGGTGAFVFVRQLTRGAFDTGNLVNVPGLAFGTIEYAFTAGEVAAFNAAAGTINVFLSGSGGPGTDAFEVSWVELEYD